MINDLSAHSVIPSKKSNCLLVFRIPNIQQSLVFLRKVEAKSLELF